MKNAFDAMLTMADVAPTGKTLETYYDSMFELYDGFVGTSVSEVSLTQQMMKTVKLQFLQVVLSAMKHSQSSVP